MEDHDDPEHWRDRAADVRVRAAETNNQGSRCVLLGTANCYDMMVNMGERTDLSYLLEQITHFLNQLRYES